MSTLANARTDKKRQFCARHSRRKYMIGAILCRFEPIHPRVLFSCCTHRVRCDPCLHSSDDFDRNANRKTKITIRASLINGDLNKPIRILIPKGRTKRTIAEGHRVLQYPASRGQPYISR